MPAPSLPAEADHRSRDEFLVRLGRELRGPLAPICNALYLLRRHPDQATVVVSAQEILDRQVRYLVHLVDDLLDMSRLAQGELTLQREDVDLRQLAAEVVEERRAAFAAADLGLDAFLPPGPLWVPGDRARLAQVLATLFENALKFTLPGGRLEVHLAADADRGQAVLTVRDTGVGIEPERLPGLFDPFVPATPMPSGRNGLGLDLAVAKGLIERHGGTIEAASAGRGTGTTFTLRLASAAEPHTGLAAPGGRLRPSRPLSVVIVEDDLDSAESLALLLQLLGHKVAVAHTGEGGIAAVRATRPDVVLCDIGLPDLDGFAVARALRGDPSTAGVPLVAITGYGEEDARRQAVEAGFEHHLVKPVDPDRLFELLAEYAARAAPMPSTVAPAAESD